MYCKDSNVCISHEWDDFYASDAEGEPGESQFKLQWNTDRPVYTVSPEINHPGIIQMRTLGEVNTYSTLYLGDSNVGYMLPVNDFERYYIIKPINISNSKIRIGLSFAPDDISHLPGIYFEKLNSDSTWFAVGSLVGITRIDTGVIVENEWCIFRIRRVSDTTIGFSINKNEEVYISTNLPNNIGMCDFFWLQTLDIDIKTMLVDHWEGKTVLER